MSSGRGFQEDFTELPEESFVLFLHPFPGENNWIFFNYSFFFQKKNAFKYVLLIL
jgi:hypothetical protein